MKSDFAARREAIVAVRFALRDERFVSESIRLGRRDGEVDAREAALALEIAQGTLRHYYTLVRVLRVIGDVDPDRTDDLVFIILLTAAYQIIWMDRIPPFAAVHEAVEEARGAGGEKAAGFANAVLRNLLRAITQRRVEWTAPDPALIRVAWDRACAFQRPLFSGAAEKQFAPLTGERPARFKQLVDRLGEAAAWQIAWASQALPVTVVQRQRLRIQADDFVRRMQAEFGADVEFAAGDDGEVASAFLPRTGRLKQSPAFREGLCYVQDMTAAAAVAAMQAQPEEDILDLCAAPGGKTIGLALAMRNVGNLQATDIDPIRLKKVGQSAERLGLDSIELIRFPSLVVSKYDAVLVDAPCSNSGVIARRPEARLRLSAKSVAGLAEQQEQLLEMATMLTKPGGRVVYSTCSIEVEENQQVVQQLLAVKPAWRLEFEQLTLPRWGPQPSAWRDGGYVARLRHVGGA